MNYLVTGATGYIGSKLVAHLHDNGNNVFALIRSGSDASVLPKKCILIPYTENIDDLASSISNNSIDLVFHLASLFIAEHKPSDVASLIDSNVKTGVVLLEAMRLAGVKKLINITTSWEYYNGNTYNPVCLYAATKRAFADLLTYYINAESFSCIHLALYDTYGPDDHRRKIIPLLMRLLKQNQSLDMSPGDQLLDLVYISDVVHAIERASQLLYNAQICLSNEFYGVYSKKPVPLKEIVRQIEQISGKQFRINWGLREYRSREVMEPVYVYETLPGWACNVSIEQGLKLLFS